MVPQSKRRYRYYEILELSQNATQEDIKRAWRKLAKRYHPDGHLDLEEKKKAEQRFKKINAAFEVLSNPGERAKYDSSPAECPQCWTHEVIQTTEAQWRCRHCGCKFIPSRDYEVIEQLAAAEIKVFPDRLRVYLALFQTTQCSWCRRFYTQPMLCPERGLHSNCFFFDGLSETERRWLISDEKWWWRMVDMILEVRDRGIMAKCREPGCFALNPNPKKSVCWRCGHDSLRCPDRKCEARPILRYNIEQDYWKCPSAGHGAKYVYRIKKRAPEPVVTDEICPNCGRNLYYDTQLLLWRCKNPECRRIYTHQDLAKVGKKTKGGATSASHTAHGGAVDLGRGKANTGRAGSVSGDFKSSEKSKGTPFPVKKIAIAVVVIIVVFIVVAVLLRGS